MYVCFPLKKKEKEKEKDLDPLNFLGYSTK